MADELTLSDDFLESTDDGGKKKGSKGPSLFKGTTPDGFSDDFLGITKGTGTKGPVVRDLFGNIMRDPFGGVSRTGVSDTVQANIGRALPGIDRYGEAANNQTWYEQMGIKAANMLVNIPAGVLESAGYLYELGEGAITGKWDFNNGYIEALNQIKDPFGDVLRKNPQSVFDMGDSAWWVQNMGGLVESVAQFYVPGVAIGKTLGGAAKIIGEAAQLGTSGMKIAQAAAQGLTATSLSYIEGAMSGREVYKSKYIAGYAKELDNLTSQGVPMEEAKVIADKKASELAGHAASTTVLTSTLLTSALNYTSLGAIFKGHDDDVLGWIRKNGQRLEGERWADWRTRMLATPEGNKQLQRLLSPGIVGAHEAQEAAQEGLEEVLNHFAEQSGLRDDGTSRSVWGAAFGQQNMGNFFNDAFTQEGALNFMLGAVGGVGNTVVMNNIPMKRGLVYDENMQPILETTAAGRRNGPEGTIVNPDGTAFNPMSDTTPDDQKKFKTKLYSSRGMSSTMNKVYYSRAIDALGADLKLIQETSSAMRDATLAGNIAKSKQLRQELANIGNFNAVIMGLGTTWQNEYRKFGSADNKQTLEGRIAPQLQAQTEEVQRLEAIMDAQSSTGNIDPTVNQQLADARSQQEKLQNEYNRLSQTTEAMEMGLAKDPSDNRYKEDANKVVKDLQKWDNRYTQLKTKYSSIDAEGAEIAESMFRREMELEINKGIISQERIDLEELKRQRDPDIVTSASTRAILNLAEQIAKMSSVEDDIKATEDAYEIDDFGTLDKLAKKYRAFSNNSPLGQGKELLKILDGLKEAYTSELETATAALDTGLSALQTEETEWMDKQKDLGHLTFPQMRERFEKAYAKNKSIDEEVLNRTAYLGALQAEIDAQELSYKKAISQGGVKKTIQWVKDEKIRVTDEISRKTDLSNTYWARRKANQKATAIARDRMVNQYQAEIQAKIDTVSEALIALDKREAILLRDTTLSRLFNKTEEQLNEIVNQRAFLYTRLNVYQEHLAGIQTAVDDAYASAVDEETNEDENITPDNGTAASSEEVLGEAAAQEEAETLQSALAEEFGVIGESTIDEAVAEFDDTDPGIVIATSNEEGPAASVPEVTPASALSLFQATHEGLITEPIISITEPTAEEGTTISATGTPQTPFLLEAELARLDEETRHIIEERITQALEERRVVNKDMFMDLVRAGKMPKNLPGAIIARMEIAIQSAPIETIPLTTIEQVTSNVNPGVDSSEGVLEDVEDTGADTSVESIPDSIPNILFNPTSDYTGFLNSPAMAKFTGKRIVDASSAVGLDQEYREGEVKYADGTKVYKKISMNEISKTKQAEKRMSPDFFHAGEVAVMIVDTAYNGNQNIDDDFSNTKNLDTGKYERTQKLVSFGDFLGTDGKIKMDDESISNFPIKIQDEAGNQAGYVRRGGWITAQYDQALDYRNVMDVYQDGDTLVTDNVTRQYDRVFETRRQIAEHYNAGRPITYSVFETKGAGQKIDNVKETESGMWAEKFAEPCTRLLPDSKLKLGVVLDGAFFTDHLTPIDDNLLTDSAKQHIAKGFYGTGQAGALIQMANGQYDIATMNPNNLDVRDANTLVRIIEIALAPKDNQTQEQKAGRQAVLDATGYDINNFWDLKKLINEQFTYTQELRDDLMLIPDTRKPGVSYTNKFAMEITQASDGRIEFKYGTTFSGTTPVGINHTNLVGGRMPAKTADAIKKGLMTRLKSVQLTGKFVNNGLNQKGGYSSIHFFEAEGWKQNVDNGGKEYASYNDYVKSVTTTYTNGTNKDSSGRYVYAVHPSIPFRPGVTAREVTEVAVEPLTSEASADPEVLPNEVSEDERSFFDDDYNAFNPISVKNVVTTVNPSIGKIIGGVPLTIENLQRLYNFTPAENMNGKTPETVLKELGKKGIGEIAPGHNPFYICG